MGGGSGAGAGSGVGGRVDTGAGSTVGATLGGAAVDGPSVGRAWVDRSAVATGPDPDVTVADSALDPAAEFTSGVDDADSSTLLDEASTPVSWMLELVGEVSATAPPEPLFLANRNHTTPISTTTATARAIARRSQ